MPYHPSYTSLEKSMDIVDDQTAINDNWDIKSDPADFI